MIRFGVRFMVRFRVRVSVRVILRVNYFRDSFSVLLRSQHYSMSIDRYVCMPLLLLYS